MVRRYTAVAFLLLVFSTAFQAQQPSTGIVLTLSQKIDTEHIDDMAVDTDGSLWLVGRAASGMATTPDALFPSEAGGGDAFVARFAPDGSLLYRTYLGGSAFDRATAVTVDAARNIYVAGISHSANFPTTPDALNPQPSPRQADGFLTKLAPGGRSLLYSTYFGGIGSASPAALAVDARGAVHVVGTAYEAGLTVTPDAAQPTSNNYDRARFDGFYIRLGAGGSTLEYGTYLGGSERDMATNVSVDASGNAYVVGWTHSGNFPVKNAIKPASTSGQGFLARFGASGMVYSTYIGGSHNDSAWGVAVSPTAVYVTGTAQSPDFPGAPRACGAPYCPPAAFIARVHPDGSAVMSTALLDQNGGAGDINVDANDVASIIGGTSSYDFPVTADAYQTENGGPYPGSAPGTKTRDVYFAVIPMTGASAGRPTYATYLGGTGNDLAGGLVSDGRGGAWLIGQGYATDFPIVNPKHTGSGPAFIAHFARPASVPQPSTDIVLHAGSAHSITGNWQLVADDTAAGGKRIWNPDAGVPKIVTASATPASSFELTFEAQAGVPYHLWLRMKADHDSWTNDSVFVQFSDTVDGSGNPVWRTGTSSAAMVSLEDCSGCGERGWGWNDNGYNTAAPAVMFSTTGTHTIRIQQREDGISIDQIVLSRSAFLTTPPGTAKDDRTILPESDGSGEPPPPPPPASDPREAVIYVASARFDTGQNWVVFQDPTAAGGASLHNFDLGQPKSTSPLASGNDYFEVRFTAEAGVPYHLWVRSQALNDYYGNDSVFVQFSDSVDASGNPIWRIGTSTATNVILEDCSGCGEQGWGWTDNSYGGFASHIYFAKSGPQTIRVLRREDGIMIDQIVLSSGKYLNASPGLTKNDTTIVQK
jgi:hypothetical protein